MNERSNGRQNLLVQSLRTDSMTHQRSHRLDLGMGAGATSRRRAVASLLTAGAVVATIGGLVGVAFGIGLGSGAWYGLGRLEPASRRHDRERLAAMVPLTADLIAAALAAGCPPMMAAAVVGQAVGGPMGRALLDAVAAAKVGAGPDQAWAAMAGVPSARSLAHALSSAIGRGTSPAPMLERIADDARDNARWTAEARARSIGARAAAPLGLCFLPAFVLLGIVPVVATSGVLLPT
jgi:Flp pilus assembly protein TadB